MKYFGFGAESVGWGWALIGVWFANASGLKGKGLPFASKLGDLVYGAPSSTP